MKSNLGHCIYCKKQFGIGVKKTEEHLSPEFTGNKESIKDLLCQICNSELGGCHTSLQKIFSLDLSRYGIKGKNNKTPKIKINNESYLKGNNFYFKDNDQVKIITYKDENNPNRTIIDVTYNLWLTNNQLRNIYRSVISTIFNYYAKDYLNGKHSVSPLNRKFDKIRDLIKSNNYSGSFILMIDFNNKYNGVIYNLKQNNGYNYFLGGYSFYSVCVYIGPIGYLETKELLKNNTRFIPCVFTIENDKKQNFIWNMKAYTDLPVSNNKDTPLAFYNY